MVCLDWHNTLDISVEADGAPKEWLLKVFSKLYRSHYPIEFRIVSYCQSRDTRENTLRFAGQFSHVCNNAILGTPPFGEFVLTWKRVGQSGKAAALAQLGACVIVDDNRPQGVLHRRRPRHRCRATRRQSRALRCLARAPRVPQPAPTHASSCQVLDQVEYLEEVGNRPQSARGGRGIFR